MNKFEQILNLITDWFGDEFEDGELDALIYDIIDLFEE
jgi:hypothetical protein